MYLSTCHICWRIGQPGRSSLSFDRPKNHKIGRRHWVLASCPVSLNSIQWFQRPGRPSWFFFTSPQKIPPQTWWRTFSSCFLSRFGKFRSVVSERKAKMSQPIRDRAAILFFRSANLVEDDEFLLPVKFCQILPAVFEKSKMWKANDGRTDNASYRLRCKFHNHIRLSGRSSPFVNQLIFRIRNQRAKQIHTFTLCVI